MWWVRRGNALLSVMRHAIRVLQHGNSECTTNMWNALNANFPQRQHQIGEMNVPTHIFKFPTDVCARTLNFPYRFGSFPLRLEIAWRKFCNDLEEGQKTHSYNAVTGCLLHIGPVHATSDQLQPSVEPTVELAQPKWKICEGEISLPHRHIFTWTYMHCHWCNWDKMNTMVCQWATLLKRINPNPDFSFPVDFVYVWNVGQ